jgi:hypothetical protein
MIAKNINIIIFMFIPKINLKPAILKLNLGGSSVVKGKQDRLGVPKFTSTTDPLGYHLRHRVDCSATAPVIRLADSLSVEIRNRYATHGELDE